MKSNSKFLNKEILQFSPSNDTKFWIQVIQNFDLQLLQFKVVFEKFE